MQHVHLALLFARLGFPEAAERQSQIVPAVSARMICQIHCLMTAAHRAADRGRPADGVSFLAQIEDLLHRGIECGAIVDPWNILGFGGQFSLFPAVENSIPDSRVDELLEMMERLFQTHARLWHQAAASDDADVLGRLPRDFQHLAEWWDQFATGSVSGMRWVSGRESLAAARRVADALSAWHQAGAGGGDLNFWRPYVGEFDSPQAYEWVIEALLEKRDLAAAMALLMHWLGRAEEVRLDEGSHSFHSLAERWLRMALGRLPPARNFRRRATPRGRRAAARLLSQVLRLPRSQRRHVLGSARARIASLAASRPVQARANGRTRRGRRGRRRR